MDIRITVYDVETVSKILRQIGNLVEWKYGHQGTGGHARRTSASFRIDYDGYTGKSNLNFSRLTDDLKQKVIAAAKAVEVEDSDIWIKNSQRPTK